MGRYVVELQEEELAKNGNLLLEFITEKQYEEELNKYWEEYELTKNNDEER